MWLIIVLAALLLRTNGINPVIFRHLTLGSGSLIRLKVFGVTVLNGGYGDIVNTIVSITFLAVIVLAAADLLRFIIWASAIKPFAKN